MAATVSRGYTFTATEQVTNTKFHSLVDSATIANIDRSNFDLTTTSPVHIGSSSPSSPAAGHLWYDTTNALLRLYDGSIFQPVSRGYSYTNRSGSSVSAGDVVIIDTANASSVKKTTTASSPLAFGVVLIGAADAASCVVITEGYCPALTVTGSTSIGQYLITSTTSGKADPITAIATGAFAVALTSSATSVAAQIGGASLIGGSINASSKFSAVDVVSSTRSSSAASGDVTYNHSLGITPTNIQVYASASANNFYSHGNVYIIGTTTFKNGVAFHDESTGTGVAIPNYCVGIASSYPTNSQLGAVSACSTTNITVTWTKTGTPAAVTMDLVFVLSG